MLSGINENTSFLATLRSDFLAAVIILNARIFVLSNIMTFF